MDKSTLSNYGWVVIVTLVLSVMLAFATPFGSYVAKATANVIKYYKTVTGDTFSADYIEGQGKEWDDYLNDSIPSKEIEDDDHIYGIGKNKSEYVLAIFNEDYSQVNIVKNGTNSDGLMMDFRRLAEFKIDDVTDAEAYENWKPYASPMALHADTLKKATVEEGVVSIGASAFATCTKLEEISFPKSLSQISKYSFLNTGLKEAIFTGKNLKDLPFACFNDCKQLTKVSVPNTVSTIEGQAFYNCINLSDFNFPSNCKNVGTYAFYKTIIPHFDLPEGLLTIQREAFRDCSKVKEYNIPSTVTTIGEAPFRWNLSLEKITVHPQNKNYKEFNNVLYTIDGTTLVSYPAQRGGDSYTLEPTTTKIGMSAFCQSHISTVTLNENLKEIGDSAFESASSLKKLHITKNVNKIGEKVVEFAVDLADVTVDSNNTSFKIGNHALYSYDGTTLYFYPVAKTGVTSFTTLATTKTIKDSAFYTLRNVKEITITEGITNIPSMCFASTQVETFNLPSTLTTISNSAFFNSQSFTSITIPSSVTSIGTRVFEQCKNLQTIYGKAGSYAQTYANNNNINFVAI